MKRRAGVIVLLVVAAALVAVVVYILKEAKSDGPKKARSARASEPAAKTASATGSAPDRPAVKGARDVPASAPSKRRRLPGSSAPIEGEGNVKMTKEGREYVEYTRDDGTRVRDFRAKARDHSPKNGSGKGPRPLEPRNAIRVKRDIRAPVWACMRESLDAMSDLAGVAKTGPIVMVIATTRSDGANVTIVGTRSFEESSGERVPELSSCIEGALVGTVVSMEGGVEQKPYEDFDLPMRFRLPGPRRGADKP